MPVKVALLVEAPLSQNVSEGKNVTFRCVFSGEENYTHYVMALTPHPNGTIPEQMTLSTGNTLVTAKFTASLEHNGININCIAFRSNGSSVDQFPSNSSSQAILQVQGRLSTVGDLNNHTMDCSVLITWTAPYTLKGVPILNYTINTIILATDTINETEHSYMYNSPKTVVFMVAAVNDAGTGNASNITITLPATPGELTISYTLVI